MNLQNVSKGAFSTGLLFDNIRNYDFYPHFMWSFFFSSFLLYLVVNNSLYFALISHLKPSSGLYATLQTSLKNLSPGLESAVKP